VKKPELHQAGIRDVAFGARVKVVEPCNLYECSIGDDCFIGPFTEIQKGAVVGARSRVQSHAFVCELVTIGEDCFIGHGVMFINDTFSSGGPARGQKELWRETVVGNRVSIGSNATIMPVRIVGHHYVQEQQNGRSPAQPDARCHCWVQPFLPASEACA